MNINSNEDVFLVRRNRDLCRIDAEIDITTIHIIGAQYFEVALERFFRITIILTNPGQPVSRVQRKVGANVVFFESVVADNVDLSYLRAIALFDVDLDTNRIVRSILNISLDINGVLAAIIVLLAQEHLDVVENRSIERTTSGKPNTT